MKSRSAVYLLKRKSKVVYVGGSNCVLSRIAQHISDKRIRFDSVELIEPHRKHYSQLEIELITKYNPYYNYPNPGSRNRKRRSTQCPHCGANLNVIVKNGVAKIKDISL